jgi:hypothetical protein
MKPAKFKEFLLYFIPAMTLPHRIFSYLVLITIFTAVEITAQNTMYQPYPTQDVRFHMAEVDITVNRNATSVSGSVSYEISAYISDTPFIRLHGRNMTVTGAMLDNEEIDFELIAGHLTLDTDGRFETDRRYRLVISYESSPGYGIHLNERGTVWTSNMPGTTSAWVPALDSPFLAMPVTMNFTIPEDLEILSVGEFSGTEVAGDGTKKVRWVSSVPVAVSDWNFAMGDLQFEEAIAGIKPVRLYTEPGTLDAGGRNLLLRRISDALGRVQRQLSMEFPYDGFNMLVLGDHRWEEKSFAAGYGYLFVNLGELEVQTDRNVLHQWFGARQRAYEGGGASVHQYYASRIFGNLREEKGTLHISDFPTMDDTVDTFYGPTLWNEAIRVWEADPGDLLPQFFSGTIQQAARMPSGVYDWNSYNRFIYEHTGTTYSRLEFDVPEIKQNIPVYEIDITEDERAGTISLEVTPLHNIPDSVIRIQMELIQADAPEMSELELQPGGGIITRSVGATLDNITFHANGLAELSQKKPFRYWLYQLRTHEDSDHRAMAANAMGGFTDDPDLQLALNDRIRNEEHPEVRAGLVRALSAITRGASGTEQQFMNFLREEHTEVKLAALEALSAYPGNEEAGRMTGRTVQTADDNRVAISAISTYRMIADTRTFREFVIRLMTSNRPPAVKAAALEELFLADGTEDAVAMAMEYLGALHSWAVREAAFQLVIRNSAGQEREDVIHQYASDRDPRMRLRALQAAKTHIDGAGFYDLYENRSRLEQDYRLKNILEGYQTSW